MRRPGEERPGRRLLGTGSGHLTLAMPLHSMDEISTWTEADGERRLAQVTFTAVKVQHLEDYIVDVVCATRNPEQFGRPVTDTD